MYHSDHTSMIGSSCDDARLDGGFVATTAKSSNKYMGFPILSQHPQAVYITNLVNNNLVSEVKNHVDALKYLTETCGITKQTLMK